MKEAVSQLPENPEALADTPVQEQAPASEAKEAAPTNFCFHRSGFSLSQDLTVWFMPVIF